MADIKEMTRPKINGTQAQPKEGAGLARRHERRADRLPQRTSVAAAMAGNPFASIRRFAEELDRLVDDFSVEHGLHFPRAFSQGREQMRRESGLVESEGWPRVDVTERDGKVFVRADLPGLATDEIQVHVGEHQVTIEGERKQEAKGQVEGYAYSECRYGRFFRSIPLPEGADTSKAAAEFRNGVLEVTIPTSPRPAPTIRQIDVRETK